MGVMRDGVGGDGGAWACVGVMGGRGTVGGRWGGGRGMVLGEMRGRGMVLGEMRGRGIWQG